MSANPQQKTTADPGAVDLELLRKYDVAGPRYTSYPTAAHFHEDVDAQAVVPRLEQSDCDSPVSVYVHLPFCRKLCWYCACTKIITKDSQRAADYLVALDKEMQLKAAVIGRRPVVQLHLGGGTPTFLSAAQIRQLGESIRRHFNVTPGVEASVEIDPRECDEEKVNALAEAGFRRASLGVQDVDPRVQEAIGRVQPMELNTKAVRLLRARGFESVNVDLIYGLPHQTPETYAQTLDRVLTLQPERFAIYSYAHVPWVNAAQKNLERVGLPAAEVKLRLLKYIIERLVDAGYVYIGMDHFARPEDELARALRENSLQRNFQGYSTHAGVEIVGLGMSAISQSEDLYYQNTKDLEVYSARVEEGHWPVVRGCQLSAEDRIRRGVINEIMCRARIDFAAISARLGIDFSAYFKDELAALAPFVDDGLVDLGPGELRITDRGRLFVRNIAMTFDAHLSGEGERRYSQTV
ncbi:oxygen-independent coproporphyrinogen III oxidase [Bradymonas sediminis]|uniref:Coproporphyrinogen-III oxidase n=1 Tax=Bradymonas sediminis TaxID=1548548 RepID=A0A2Z4FJJ3_9DELT|nr:oxygen-independent coproporphyrinogen III oxidase [Bradymonas sediminis]AWV88858.1 oxygen-independent coproporphyrinogen III oxidase [Bradymonas sediminis]TDP71860.1 anaerobic coproporphyrinogen III oxidase [Bradymonas sediminis]